MWSDLIKNLTTKCEFRTSASPNAISAAETALKIKLPDDLSSLLVESNGIEGEYGLGLVWPVERIQTDNLAFRGNVGFQDLYMPFENLLFFADAGNGDQFAFAICNQTIQRADIFVWNHENDSRTWVAPSLRRYLEWWLTDKIKV